MVGSRSRRTKRKATATSRHNRQTRGSVKPVTAVVGLPSSAAAIRFDARSVAVIRPASRSGDERLCADRAADAEIKFLGRYKGGFIRDGVLVAIGAINAA